MNIPSGLLRYGSRSNTVADLQRELNSAGFNCGAVDGIFGSHTRAAVVAFQRAKHIGVDGIVGKQTWGALGGDRFEGGGRPSGSRGVGDAPSGGGQQVTAYVNGQPRQITVVPVGNGQYMRADAASHFDAMMNAAHAAGYNLYAESGFRTMAKQQYLYNGYINHLPGFNLAARPGYSNHQNGIAMDIGNVGGYGSAAYNWLRNNAGRFGFTNDVGGEYWHFDYRG